MKIWQDLTYTSLKKIGQSISLYHLLINLHLFVDRVIYLPMASKDMKRCSTSLFSKEMQIKTTMIYLLDIF